MELDYKKDNFTVLYIGDTGDRRGLKTVVSGLKILRQEKGINDIKFLIIGIPQGSKLGYLIFMINISATKSSNFYPFC